jgi:hypothetical protein
MGPICVCSEQLGNRTADGRPVVHRGTEKNKACRDKRQWGPLQALKRFLRIGRDHARHQE